MKNKTQFFAIGTIMMILSLSVLFSCKKDSKPTDQEMLNGNWKMIDLQASSSGFSGSVYADLPSCAKDNVYQINSAGTYTISEGSDVCAPSDADQGTWTLLENNTAIKFTGTADEKTFTMTNLTATSVMLSYDDTSGGVTTHYTAVYQKQ